MMNFDWDEDGFDDDQQNDFFGFENDTFNPDIFSDASSISSSVQTSQVNPQNYSSQQSNFDYSSFSSGITSVDSAPLMKNVKLPTYPMNLPRKRFGMSQSKSKFINHQQLPVMMPPPMFTAKIELSAMEKFQPRRTRRKIETWTSPTASAARTDQLFNDICLNTNATLNPVQLGFIPSYFWPNKDIPFVDLVYDFFQRKNHVNCRFFHKLFDALRVASVSEAYAELTGVQWVTDNVFKVNKGQFARLLGIKAIDGSLFHQQGNFPTHGFVELNIQQANMFCPGFDTNKIDFDDVRLLIHQPGIFTRTCNEAQLMTCSPMVRKNRSK
ncbi:hypothetical protein TRFO_06923 [Tritrichomonas foetus]|uniref:Initiator binding domain-containing protein n=1 Tax=Tritrichomonas foetus TaxID=1144522 RepID=A0A1J4JZC1_9EUKA|nr:hypothetical protein TRFO_06923 [Tritrichomonas foetus]|eukprot:OHT02876.1 hypothetical protein TRFO_06923 [Tritrichomonas foetus]